MKMKHALICLLTLLSLSSSAQDVYDSVYVDGHWRTYNVHLPYDYNPINKYPLVLGFHGGQQITTSSLGWYAFAYQSEFSEKADSSGFIMVYPEGRVFMGNRTWNAGECCPPAMLLGYDDVGFVDTLLDVLFQLYAIDTTKVYATGSSNGGMMCYRLACELGQRFAAIAPNACSHMISPCNPSKIMPIISFHSKIDSTVFYSGGFGGNPILSGIFFPSQDSVVAIWTNNDSCSITDTIVNGAGVDYDFIKISSCTCNAEIHHYATTDGGHSWPGGNPNENPVSTQLAATDLIWDFFQNYTLACSLVAVPDQQQSRWKIFPNPCSTDMNIENLTGEINYVLFNIFGQEVLKGETTGKIDLSNLKCGIYSILLKQGNEETVEKFLKN